MVHYIIAASVLHVIELNCCHFAGKVAFPPPFQLQHCWKTDLGPFAVMQAFKCLTCVTQGPSVVPHHIAASASHLIQLNCCHFAGKVAFPPLFQLQHH